MNFIFNLIITLNLQNKAYFLMGCKKIAGACWLRNDLLHTYTHSKCVSNVSNVSVKRYLSSFCLVKYQITVYTQLTQNKPVDAPYGVTHGLCCL